METIYFGGGTPSLLDRGDISKLLDAIRSNFKVAVDAEITFEANPDDIDRERLLIWKDNGINRLSIGVQSFFDEELIWMNRAHNAAHARSCIEQSHAAGFNNISIDLIYGSPLLTDDNWNRNIEIATGYGIPHLSCYALTVEEKTALHKTIRLGAPPVDEEKQAKQFIHLMEVLRSKDYLHYEVSNFAKPGFESRHNSAYWQGKTYLGLGPSAHSFDGKERSWNIANNAVYAKTILSGELPLEKELLTEDQQVNEHIMISLRTMKGLDLNVVEDKWGSPEKIRLEKGLQKYLDRKLVTRSNDTYTLTDEGMLSADGIASDLFR